MCYNSDFGEVSQEGNNDFSKKIFVHVKNTKVEPCCSSEKI